MHLNFSMLSFKQIKRKLGHYTWDLAYGVYTNNILQDGLSGLDMHIIVNPFKDKWFADPFIYKETETELHLFVEEFDIYVQRGRIAYLIIDKGKDIISSCRIILDLPTHLSFPSIYCINDVVYVQPENSQQGGSWIYRYDPSAIQLVDPVCVIKEPIADAVIIKNKASYEMYATKDPNPNGNILHKFVADSFWGPYEEDERISFKTNVARMAGAFIDNGEHYIRPAQDCNGAYGKAVKLMIGNEVISELYPKSLKYAGLHTFNVKNKTFVVDLKKYDYPILYKIKSLLNK